MNRLLTVAILAFTFLSTLFTRPTAAADSFVESEPVRFDAPTVVQKTLFDEGAVLYLLSNGLRVYIQPSESAQNALIYASICHTGSQNEDPWLGTGISALTGKLVCQRFSFFQGTENTNFQPIAETVSTEIKKDRTDFWATLSSSQILSACDLFASGLLRARFDQKSFAEMKSQLAQELLNEEAFPEFALTNTLEQAIYQIHPRRYPSEGYSSLMEGIAFDEVQRFYRERYTPNNTLFCILGNIDPEAVIKRLAENYRGTVRGREFAPSTVTEPQQTAPREVIRETQGRQCHLFFAWPTVSLTDPDWYPLQALSAYLSLSSNAPLAHLNRNGHSLESSFSSSASAFSSVSGYFTVYSPIQPNEILAAGEAIEALFHTLAQDGIPEEDLNQAKKIVESSFVYGQDHLYSIAETTVTNLLMTGSPHRDSEILEGIRRTTSDDIKRVIQRYLIPSRQNRILISPNGRLLSTVSRSQRNFQPLATYRLPQNGVRVVVKKTTSLPRVSVQILFLGGSLFENETNAGIGQLLAETLGKGSAHYSQTEMERFFTSIGGEYSFSSGLNSLSVGINVLESDWQKALAYIADALLFPNFSEEALEQAKERVVEKIANRAQNPYRRLYDEFVVSLPTSTPYHLPLLGTQKSISSVTLDNLKAHYMRVVAPERMVVSIFGGIDPQEACTVANNLFARIPSSSGDQRVPFDSYNMFREAVELRKPSSDGVGIGLMAWPSAGMGNVEDDAALMVLKILLAGSREYPGRLFNRFVNLGLENSLRRGNFSMDQYRGPFAGYTLLLFGVPLEKVPVVYQAVEQELNQLRFRLLPSEEVEAAKQRLIAERLQKDSDAEQARQAGLIRIYDLGENYEAELEEAIERVSPETIATIVRKYFNVSMKVSTLPEKP